MWGGGGMWVRSDVTSGRKRRWEWPPDAGDAEDGKTTQDGCRRGAPASDVGLIFADVVWLQVLLEEFGAIEHIRRISQLHGDNHRALALASNPEYHARTKHIDIQCHFIQEIVMAQKVYLVFCPSSDMIADIMTKALPRTTHERLTMAMGMVNGAGKQYRTPREGACQNFHEGSIRMTWTTREMERSGLARVGQCGKLKRQCI